MAKTLSAYKALTFDCYGTLIDWESGIWDALQPLLQRNGCDEVTRGPGLEAFAAAESAQQDVTPDMLYPEILARVHRTLAVRYGLATDDAMDAAFGASVPFWPAFPDTADALRVLKRHYRLVILSNVNRDGFAASNRKLGVAFDAIYTAQDVGSYKPNLANFDYLLKNIDSDLDIAPGDILHTAQSLFHDHVPAAKAGLDRCWIDRQALSKGGAWGATAPVAERPDVNFLFPTLGAMAEAVLAEAG